MTAALARATPTGFAVKAPPRTDGPRRSARDDATTDPDPKAGPEQTARRFAAELAEKWCRSEGWYALWASNATLMRRHNLTAKQLRDWLKHAETYGHLLRFRSRRAFTAWLTDVGGPSYGLDYKGPPNWRSRGRVIVLVARLPPPIRPAGLVGALGFPAEPVAERPTSPPGRADHGSSPEQSPATPTKNATPAPPRARRPHPTGPMAHAPKGASLAPCRAHGPCPKGPMAHAPQGASHRERQDEMRTRKGNGTPEDVRAVFGFASQETEIPILPTAPTPAQAAAPNCTAERTPKPTPPERMDPWESLTQAEREQRLKDARTANPNIKWPAILKAFAVQTLKTERPDLYEGYEERTRPGPMPPAPISQGNPRPRTCRGNRANVPDAWTLEMWDAIQEIADGHAAEPSTTPMRIDAAVKKLCRGLRDPGGGNIYRSRLKEMTGGELVPELVQDAVHAGRTARTDEPGRIFSGYIRDHKSAYAQMKKPTAGSTRQSTPAVG